MKIPFLNIEIKKAVEEVQSQSRPVGSVSLNPYNDVMGARINRGNLFSAYRNSSDIFSCIREIQQAVGSGGYVYKVGETEKENEKIDALFTKKYGNFQSFKDEVIKQVNISGDCFIEKIKNPLGEVIALKIIDSRSMAIVADEFGTVRGYIQHTPYGSLRGDAKVFFTPDEILHWRIGINTDNELFGISPLEHLIWEVSADISASISNYYIQENNSVPAAFIIFDQKASDEELKRTIEMMRQQNKGSKNRGKITASKNITDIKTIQHTHVDMQFLEGRRFATEKVCSAFGVPKSMLGYTEGMTFNNQEGQVKKFYLSTGKNYETWIAFQINNLLESLLYQERIHFFTPTFDEEESLYSRAISGREKGLLTTNEARDIIGYEPLDTAKHGDYGDMIVSGTGASSTFLTDIALGSESEDVEKIAKMIKKLDV